MPRPPPFQSTLTRPATIYFETRYSLLIGSHTGTHGDLNFTRIKSTGSITFNIPESWMSTIIQSGIGLSHDFPREIDMIHEKLYPVLKKAKKEKQSAFFQVDKLIINGQVYRGLKTTNLPYYGKIMSSNQRVESGST